MSAKEKKERKKQAAVTDALVQVLADSYTLMGMTHAAHWNVTGSNFFGLHAAFEEQYTELFAAIDEIAERVRALGVKIPGGLAAWAGMSGLEEFGAEVDARGLVKGLVKGHEKTLGDLRVARDAASDLGDKESEDLLVGRIQTHQKTLWMLESSLAGD